MISGRRSRSRIPRSSHASRPTPRTRRLLPIPGIGPTIAAILLAEVWDVSRFPSAEHLCVWAGLTPTERSRADHTRRGHISKRGSRWLRWVMVEAAVRALGNPQLGVFYTSIEKRRGSKIARIAWPVGC